MYSVKGGNEAASPHLTSDQLYVRLSLENGCERQQAIVTQTALFGTTVLLLLWNCFGDQGRTRTLTEPPSTIFEVVAF